MTTSDGCSPVAAGTSPIAGPIPSAQLEPGLAPSPDSGTVLPPVSSTMTVHVAGMIPSELWNRLGNKILPKLRQLKDLKILVNFSASVDAGNVKELKGELDQILEDLGLKDSVNVN